jgi:hypothetical protein
MVESRRVWVTTAVIVDGYIRVCQVRGRGGPSFISPRVQRERIELVPELELGRIRANWWVASEKAIARGVFIGGCPRPAMTAATMGAWYPTRSPRRW